MIFKQIESGGDRNYAYLAASEKTNEGALVDPSPDPVRVMKEASVEGVVIKYVINTHSHSDHSGGNYYFRNTGKAKTVTFINCSKETAAEDGQILRLGENLTLQFISTPGHTPDSICIMVKDGTAMDVIPRLLTGDTLFVGKVGGTWGEAEAREEFASLRKLMLLPQETEVWPGHNYGVKTSSTIGFELNNNPFIQRLDDFNEFLWLKQNWARYKEEHGIK